MRVNDMVLFLLWKSPRPETENVNQAAARSYEDRSVIKRRRLCQFIRQSDFLH